MTQWSKLFPQRIFDRGEIYFENQMVQSVQLASDKEHFTAQVQGGIGRYYNVSGRLRPDGRASELKCDCPWAKKGHRCKHQVAVLMAAEEKQKNADENTNNSSKVDFKNLVSDKVKQAVIQANPAVDPFELIGQRTFSQESYDRALQLSNSLQEINFRRVDDKMRAYEYIWNFENENGKYVLIDTAGIRKKSKVNERIEKFSVMRSLLAVERADVCLMLIDANDGVTDQDAKIAGEAHEAGKGVIIVVNKWDEYEKTTGTLENYKKEIYSKLAYLSYAPIIFISAKTGQRVDKLFPLINHVAEQNAMRISTSVLNQVINEAIAIVQPPTDKGKRLKIFYGTQASTKPPTFVIFVNSKDLFHFSYERYLVNQIRKEFGLEGTPIRIIVREKTEKEVNKI